MVDELIRSPLVNHNNLSRLISGVWVNKDKNSGNFAYSDGDRSEEFIKNVLSTANDLSSNSIELDSKWIDWPSEYHLSSRRANLVRAIDLTDVHTVLEIGSGCGAITRYLGEMDIDVDSVEGSQRRAEITKLRCRDLNTVNVVCENFNALNIPKNTYDAVFLIGVTEYAERFSPSKRSHHNAVINMLEKAREALTENGIILIAIENRLGFKYLFGASEDHYGVKNIGVYGYPNYKSKITDKKKGIRTYDKKEWEDILSNIDGLCHEFFYPFPDYKLPQVILSNRFAETEEYAHSNLSRVNSRDYKHYWVPCIDEHLFWETTAKSGNLNAFSNSYVIVLAKSSETLEKVINFDFVHFPNPKRKPKFRSITLKPRGAEEILKRQCDGEKSDCKAGKYLFRPRNQKYLQGNLLSDIWVRALKVFDETKVFDGLVKEYYHFLVSYFQEHKDTSMLVDVIPFNIIVDKKGRYNCFDFEWKTEALIIPEFVFFRATLYFGCIQRKCLEPFYRTINVHTIHEFVAYCFDIISVNLSKHLPEFIDQENRFQTQVLLSNSYKSVEERLALNVYEDEPTKCMAFYPKIYWTGEDGIFREEWTVSLSAALGAGRQKLLFVMPFITFSLKKVRFDPADHTLFGNQKQFQLFEVKIIMQKGKWDRPDFMEFKES